MVKFSELDRNEKGAPIGIYSSFIKVSIPCSKNAITNQICFVQRSSSLCIVGPEKVRQLSSEMEKIKIQIQRK